MFLSDNVFILFLIFLHLLLLSSPILISYTNRQLWRNIPKDCSVLRIFAAVFQIVFSFRSTVFVKPVVLGNGVPESSSGIGNLLYIASSQVGVWEVSPWSYKCNKLIVSHVLLCFLQHCYLMMYYLLLRDFWRGNLRRGREWKSSAGIWGWMWIINNKL